MMPNKLVLRLFEHNIWILILVDKRMLAYNCKLKIIKKFLFPKKFIFNTFEMNENFFWKKNIFHTLANCNNTPLMAIMFIC